VEGTVGRQGAFEVAVNGVGIHSKLDTGTFPQDSSVIVEKVLEEHSRAIQEAGVENVKKKRVCACCVIS
jgi:hypothetical protein